MNNEEIDYLKKRAWADFSYFLDKKLNDLREEIEAYYMKMVDFIIKEK